MNTIKAHSVAMPSQRLTDPAFRCVPACATDLAETFRRAREKQRAAEVKFIHVVINNAPTYRDSK